MATIGKYHQTSDMQLGHSNAKQPYSKKPFDSPHTTYLIPPFFFFFFDLCPNAPPTGCDIVI